MKYSNRSFHFSIIAIVIVLIFLGLSNVERQASWNVDDIIGYLIILLAVCAFMGFFTSLIAMRERPNKRKWFSLFISGILIVAICIMLSKQIIDA